MTDVSVIIVSWNTRELLRGCLESVYMDTRDASLEVIVVDNASEDGSADMVETAFPAAKVIRSASNAGFAAGNNAGMRAATGRWMLLLNSDTVVRDGAIDKTVECAERRADAGLVGCRIENADGSLQPSCARFPSLTNLVLMTTYLYRLLPGSRFAGRERMTWWAHDDEREVDVLTGCYLLVRREAYEKVGGFDEAYFFGGEEVDWCFRMRKAGWKRAFTPAARITHFGGGSAGRLGWRLDALQTRAAIRIFRTHYGPATAACAEALLWVFNASRMAAWGAVSLLAGRRRKAARERFEHFHNIIVHWRRPAAAIAAAVRGERAQAAESIA